MNKYRHAAVMRRSKVAKWRSFWGQVPNSSQCRSIRASRSNSDRRLPPSLVWLAHMCDTASGPASLKRSTSLTWCWKYWVDKDNPVRVIDAFVDGLDLKKLGFETVDPLDIGRPGYHPSIPLKLYIYGYLYRVQSSRWLERECHRNLEVMWLLGRLAPDHKTIADFRKDNGAAIKNACGQFVSYARRCRRSPPRWPFVC
jgi:hypothetical protein